MIYYALIYLNCFPYIDSYTHKTSSTLWSHQEHIKFSNIVRFSKLHFFLYIFLIIPLDMLEKPINALFE